MEQYPIIPEIRVTVDLLTAQLSALNRQHEEVHKALLYQLQQMLPLNESIEDYEDICDQQGRILGIRKKGAPAVPPASE